VRANSGAVQQLALNLLQNAADASPPGALIRVATRQEGEHAVLEVVDRGSGIRPEVLERMFEPLFTTKPEGTGLGLTIVKRIVDDHRGAIQVESEVGRGTTFRILFPSA
jgi:signal transduction histidine kinase